MNRKEPVVASEREKLEKELAELRKDGRHHAPEFRAPGPVEVTVVGGRVFVKSDGEVSLDQAGLHSLQQTLAKAFQAVS